MPYVNKNPQTPEEKRQYALQTLLKLQRIQENPSVYPDHVLDLAYGKERALLNKPQELKRMLGLDPTQQFSQLKYAADGGIIETEQPVGELSLLAPDDEYEIEEDLTSPDLTALRDVLGEEKYVELESAMADYPVVAEVAEMATYQTEGEVSGPGTEKSDSVPARLSDGEYVWSAEALKAFEAKYGEGSMEQLHNEFKNSAAMELV